MMSDERYPSSSHTPDSHHGDSPSELSDPRRTVPLDRNTQLSIEKPNAGARSDSSVPIDNNSASNLHIAQSVGERPQASSQDSVDLGDTAALHGYELTSVTTLLRQDQIGRSDASEPTARTATVTGQPAASNPPYRAAKQSHIAGEHNMFRRPSDRVAGAQATYNPDPGHVERASPRSVSPSTIVQPERRTSPFQRPASQSQSSGPVEVQPEIASTNIVESNPIVGGNNTRSIASASPLVAVYQQHDARARVASVQRGLEDAVEAWWTESQLPSKALLRNGLLVLEAGHTLDEAHLTLLLRTALRYRRGMLTALKHQTDPDRTAFLIKEALLFEKNPLPTETLWMLQTEDPAADEWSLLLDDDLHYHLQSLSSTRRGLALAAIQQLGSAQPISQEEIEQAATIVMSNTRPFSWTVGRAILLLLMVPALISVYSLRAQRSTLAGMASIPVGQYVTGTVSVAGGFSIDQTEVTNLQYRLCVQQGVCIAPEDISSATRERYYLNPLYDDYPVVQVDWYMARQYCEWGGKRLPTAAEWEIAASTAPATERNFDYPWGNTFLQQYANSSLTDIGDTKEVGSYHPTGTSPTGATDMAGNVAEWTTTNRSLELYKVSTGQTFMAKGGSYQDQPEALRSSAGVQLPNTATESWLGFRCAVTTPE